MSNFGYLWNIYTCAINPGITLDTVRPRYPFGDSQSLRNFRPVFGAGLSGTSKFSFGLGESPDPKTWPQTGPKKWKKRHTGPKNQGPGQPCFGVLSSRICTRMRPSFVSPKLKSKKHFVVISHGYYVTITGCCQRGYISNFRPDSSENIFRFSILFFLLKCTDAFVWSHNFNSNLS